MTNSRFGVFVAGAMFAITISMVVQDSMGMEEFLRRAQQGWITLHPVVWLPVLYVCVHFGLLVPMETETTETPGEEEG